VVAEIAAACSTSRLRPEEKATRATARGHQMRPKVSRQKVSVKIVSKGESVPWAMSQVAWLAIASSLPRSKWRQRATP